MYPRINIDLKKIQHNARAAVELCRSMGIQVAAVTKGYCADPRVTAAIIGGGVHYLADSKIENLRRLQEFPLKKLLLRLPMISQGEATVIYADISLNSELVTIQSLNHWALKLGKIHGIILMIDLGDLREGIFRREEFREVLYQIQHLKGIYVAGIGTNLTCFGGVIPKEGHLSLLLARAQEAESILGYPMEIISGGNSSSIYLALEGRIPWGINQLRLGEAILLGTESAFGNAIAGSYQDALQLEAEIIELKEKASLPIGEIGRDAFGNVPVFRDQGTLKRAVLAVGKQDIGTLSIIPRDPGAEVLGASSDHLIVNVTESTAAYRVGDTMTFDLGYGAMLALMTSEYVDKHYIS